MVSNGKFFCNVCHEEIGLEKTIILSHIESTKQGSGKIRIAKKEARKRNIVESLVVYDNKVGVPLRPFLRLSQGRSIFVNFQWGSV